MPTVDPTKSISEFAGLVALFFRELVEGGVPPNIASAMTMQFISMTLGDTGKGARVDSLRELLGAALGPKETA